MGELPADLNVEPTKRVVAALLDSDVALPEGVVNVALVDDAKSRELNRNYSGNDYATDVLSFSYIEDGAEPIEGVVGELAISLETAQRQATAAGTSLADELALLVLHGLLHVSGLDHQTPEQQDQIQTLQKQIMEAAGCTYREFKWEA